MGTNEEQRYLCSVMDTNLGIESRDVEAREPIEALVKIVQSIKTPVIRAIIDTERVNVPEVRIEYGEGSYLVYEEDTGDVPLARSLAIYSAPSDGLLLSEPTWEKFIIEGIEGYVYVRR